jgi:hypothetical protein
MVGEIAIGKARNPDEAQRNPGTTQDARSRPRISLRSIGATMLLRRDQRHRPKIMAMAPSITRQQRQALYRRVDADEKIRQHSGTGSSGA